MKDTQTINRLNIVVGRTYTPKYLFSNLAWPLLAKYGLTKGTVNDFRLVNVDVKPQQQTFARIHGRWMQVGINEKIVYKGKGKWKTKINYRRV